MGKLLYGPKIEIALDDQTLLHLDTLLTVIPSVSFQLHAMVGGPHDGNLLSLAVRPGVPISMEYYNGPELTINNAVLERAIDRARQGGFVTVPFDFTV